MNISRISAFAVCFAVGLAVVSEPTMAKRKKNKSSYRTDASAEQLPAYSSSRRSSSRNSNSTGYPNGRPFQAIKVDFEEMHDRFDNVDGDLDSIQEDLDAIGETVDTIEENTETILEEIADLNDMVDDNSDKLDAIGADVTMLKDTLTVQVSVESATLEERNAGVDSDVILYVQVIRNGIGLDKLLPGDFTYGNSFPAAAARYCGVACFEEGVGGMYKITLEVDESDATFAGTLMVDDEDGAGTSQVSFDIPAAPVEPTPLPDPAV